MKTKIFLSVCLVLVALTVTASGCDGEVKCDCGCAMWDTRTDPESGVVYSVCVKCERCNQKPDPVIFPSGYDPSFGDGMGLKDALDCATKGGCK